MAELFPRVQQLAEAGGSRSGFSVGLAPYQIKEPLSRSWGQKPKLDSTSWRDTTCKAQFEFMSQRHCKSKPLNTKQKRGEGNIVFCPCILPACSSVRAAIHRVAGSLPLATEKMKKLQLFSAVYPIRSGKHKSYPLSPLPLSFCVFLP